MRTRGETRLVALVVAVSLALTGLTVWSVARQGRALHQREMADLMSAALTAAAQRRAALLAELQRACDAASRVWQIGGLDDLDVWAADQRNWLLTYIAARGAAWVRLPRTPLEQPLPGPRDPNDRGPPSDRYDLNATLEYFKRLASSPDPLTRAGAMLGTATYEQQLGHPLAAARILADAANLLRSTPGLARFAFRAEMRQIDSLLAAGDHERARDALEGFVASMRKDHPARLGMAEVEQLQSQAAALAVDAADPLALMLNELEQRARRCEAVASAVGRLLRSAPATTTQPADDLSFIVGSTGDGRTIVVALRAIADDARMALVSPLKTLLDRYGDASGMDVPWRVVPPDRIGDRVVLADLGPAFAGAALVPTEATAARLAAASHRRLAILLATGIGSIGAWGLVVWMMVRAMARQRELAHLQNRFVADISHELKTPLALIRLLSETLAEGRVRDPTRMRSYHETITRESERLTALLDNILDMGRIESGRKTYRFGACDLAAVARQAWALFEPQFNNEGFTTRLEIADGLPIVRADTAALQQVLVNLLQNAYRYSTERKFVRLTVAREQHLIVMMVEDHGIGMSPNQLDRLGQSFFRAEDTRVRQTRGTGLGLAIVNHIVTAHRGKVEVQSAPGEGSTFSVWIPCEPVE